MGCVNHIQFRAPITPEPSRVEHVAFVPAAPPSTPGDASWSPSSPAVGRFFSKDSGKSWEIVKIWWLFMGLFWYFLWGYLVWDIIKWDIMKYQWVMMIWIWWDIDLYCGLYVIHIMGILWEYDRNMMGIWWLSWGYCGKSLGVLWECCRYLIKYQWEYDEFPKTWWLSYGGFHKWGIPQMSSVQNPSLIPLDWLFNIDSPIGLL